MCAGRSPRCGARVPTMYSPFSVRCWVPAWTRRRAGRGSAWPCRHSTPFPTSPTDMNRRHASVLVLAVAACGGGGPKVALRYHPPAGAVYHYALEQRTQVSIQSGPLAAMGNQKLFMRMQFTQTVKGPTEGGTEVEVVFESVTMEIPGVSPDVIARELAKLNGLRSTVVYDARGKVVRSTVAPAPGVPPELTKEMSTGVQSMTFGFPDQPVGHGDSWTVTTNLPLPQVPGATGSPAGPAKTTLTVREIRV